MSNQFVFSISCSPSENSKIQFIDCKTVWSSMLRPYNNIMMKDAPHNRLCLGCPNLCVSLLTISLICPFHSYSIFSLPWIIDFDINHSPCYIVAIDFDNKYSFCSVSYKILKSKTSIFSECQQKHITPVIS
jgi:hypothetical protein